MEIFQENFYGGKFPGAELFKKNIALEVFAKRRLGEFNVNCLGDFFTGIELSRGSIRRWGERY